MNGNERQKMGGRMSPIRATIRRLVGRTRAGADPGAPVPDAAAPTAAAPEPEKQQVYWLRPVCGGLANNVEIQTDDGKTLYQVRAAVFSATGRRYVVNDVARRSVYLHSRQEYSCLFPRHRVFCGEEFVARVGQNAVCPGAYYIYHKQNRIDLRMSAFSTIYPVTRGDELLAEAGQGRGCWCVVMAPSMVDPLLPLIAIIYRENTIGG